MVTVGTEREGQMEGMSQDTKSSVSGKNNDDKEGPSFGDNPCDGDMSDGEDENLLEKAVNLSRIIFKFLTTQNSQS